MMQITDSKEAHKIAPLFRLGFRPFFLGGALFSVCTMLLWLMLYSGVLNFQPLGGGYWWHIHEMIFGFGCAIIAGFLLTAVQTWTGLPSVQGKTLTTLFVLWLIGRVVVMYPSLLGTTFTTLIDLAFLPTVAFILAKPILAVKQYRNLFFVPLLVIFTIANAEMHASIYYPNSVSSQSAGYAGVMLITLLISIMAGRVVPMFTANGTKTTKISALPWLDKLTNGSLALITILLLLHPAIGMNSFYIGVILIFAGIFQTIRWFRWRPWISLGMPLLWSLHLAIKALAFGLILLGMSYLIPKIPTNHIWHLLTVGGIGGVILAMISRVSLGHTGRTLQAPKLMSLAFLTIVLASLLRSFGPWFMPTKTLLFIDISGLLWIVSFTLFIIFYGPMLLKARIDGRPG
ncbi:NnrS family protein [Cognaticolwellia beringensis]|uniref:NnrS family protein n=1 Tax=Cognaticolwellia beringensis TaxID=1967665 RepID=A0A222G9T4_9GAMM|nr:NnrS family protein [Cognaticolwellia beringensis]ASP48393.1 NnrS family protein [Cognaticolwellia beringensis]